MKKMTITLYEYSELNNDAKQHAIQEYLTDNSELYSGEFELITDSLTDNLYNDLDLWVYKSDLEFTFVDHTDYVNLKGGNDADLWINQDYNREVLARKLKKYNDSLINTFINNVYYRYDKDDKKIYFDRIENCNELQTTIELANKINEYLKSINDRLSDIVELVLLDCYNLENNFLEYKNEETLNNEFSDLGWYFTAEGKIIDSYTMDTIENKIGELIDDYSLEMDIEED